MLDGFRGRRCTSTPLRPASAAGADGATLRWADGREKTYDRVVLATHADEALALLEDPPGGGAKLLGAWRYQPNQTVLHTDASVMPGPRPGLGVVELPARPRGRTRRTRSR